MMDQERWKRLDEEFTKEERFDEEGNYIYDRGYPPFNLMNWLECSSTSPSGKMITEFYEHGYRVYPTDRDSFGWLVGAVSKDGKRIYFG